MCIAAALGSGVFVVVRGEADLRRRRVFLRRLAGAETCPVAGPCGRAPCALCERRQPHPCEIGRLLAQEVSLEEAVALALDAVLYPGDRRRALTLRGAIVKLAGQLCREHRRLVQPLLKARLKKPV